MKFTENKAMFILRFKDDQWRRVIEACLHEFLNKIIFRIASRCPQSSVDATMAVREKSKTLCLLHTSKNIPASQTYCWHDVPAHTYSLPGINRGHVEPVSYPT